MNRTAVDEGTTVDSVVDSVPNDVETDGKGGFNVIVVSNVIDRPTDYLIVCCNANPKENYIEDIFLVPLFRDYPTASFCLGKLYEEIVFLNNSNIWTPAFPTDRLVIPYCLEGKGPTHPFPTFKIRKSDMGEYAEPQDNWGEVLEKTDKKSSIKMGLGILRQFVGMPVLYSLNLEETLEEVEETTKSNLEQNTIKFLKELSQSIVKKIEQFEPINFQHLYETKSQLSSKYSGYRTIGFMHKQE